MHSIGIHVQAMLDLQKMGAIAFDYGNNIRHLHSKPAFGTRLTSRGSSRPTFARSSARGRTIPMGGSLGDPNEFAATDDVILELFPERRGSCRGGSAWLATGFHSGLPARICWLDRDSGPQFGERLNDLVARCLKRPSLSAATTWTAVLSPHPIAKPNPCATAAMQ